MPSSGHEFVNLSKCCSSVYKNDTETNELILEKPENCSKNAILPEAEYFSNVVLQITDGMENTGGLNMPLFGYLEYSEWRVVTIWSDILEFFNLSGGE